MTVSVLQSSLAIKQTQFKCKTALQMIQFMSVQCWLYGVSKSLTNHNFVKTAFHWFFFCHFRLNGVRQTKKEKNSLPVLKPQRLWAVLFWPILAIPPILCNIIATTWRATYSNNALAWLWRVLVEKSTTHISSENVNM